MYIKVMEPRRYFLQIKMCLPHRFMVKKIIHLEKKSDFDYGFEDGVTDKYYLSVIQMKFQD